MFYALNWFAVIVLLALWSLATWALHAAAAWTVSNAGLLPGALSGTGTLTVPDGLASWAPPEVMQWANQLIAGVAPFVDSLLRAAPALADGLAVAAWVIWAIGGVLLLLAGAGLHLLIALVRRRGGSRTGSNSSAALAAT